MATLTAAPVHNPYASLHLRRVVNADGMKTRWGGSLMPPEVVDAMRAAASSFVDLNDLHRAAGARIASLINTPAIEDAAVVCGAAAGLAVATAACVAGSDGPRIRSLPHLDWPGAKTEVVIPKSHLTGYAQAFRNAGPRLVEVGDSNGATPEELTAAITDRTAAVAFCGGELPGNARFPTKTPLAQLCQIAHDRGVPVIVDAAAELPPPEHLRLFSVLGADLVVFSGGKGLRGPQASGLILGRHDLVEACRLNQNPNSSMGRPMKVGKEEIMGLLRAVELYVARDHAADLRYWEDCTATVLDAVRDLDGLTAERFHARTIAQAKLTLDPTVTTISAAGLIKQLRDGDPSICVSTVPNAPNSLLVNPHNLEPGEADLIATRLRQLLTTTHPA
jgi:L-seryl-tRNA(Ser) seleniumtransferase